jgi:hypothetical protein
MDKPSFADARASGRVAPLAAIPKERAGLTGIAACRCNDSPREGCHPRSVIRTGFPGGRFG